MEGNKYDIKQNDIHIEGTYKKMFQYVKIPILSSHHIDKSLMTRITNIEDGRKMVNTIVTDVQQQVHHPHIMNNVK